MSFFGLGVQSGKKNIVLANFPVSYQVLIWHAASIGQYFQYFFLDFQIFCPFFEFLKIIIDLINFTRSHIKNQLQNVRLPSNLVGIFLEWLWMDTKCTILGLSFFSRNFTIFRVRLDSRYFLVWANRKTEQGFSQLLKNAFRSKPKVGKINLVVYYLFFHLRKLLNQFF